MLRKCQTAVRWTSLVDRKLRDHFVQRMRKRGFTITVDDDLVAGARKRVHRTEKKSEEKSFRWTKKTLMKRIQIGQQQLYRLGGTTQWSSVLSGRMISFWRWLRRTNNGKAQPPTANKEVERGTEEALKVLKGILGTAALDVAIIVRSMISMEDVG